MQECVKPWQEHKFYINISCIYVKVYAPIAKRF